MPQTVVPLTEEFAQHNQKQRDWVKGHFIENADQEYASLEGKLRLLDAIIKEKWIEPTETWKLQALGITFGDMLEQSLKLEWVTVRDEHGEDPALSYPGTTVLIFPLTVISKRIERGEAVDIYEIFDGFCEMIRNRVSGSSSDRKPS